MSGKAATVQGFPDGREYGVRLLDENGQVVREVKKRYRTLAEAETAGLRLAPGATTDHILRGVL